ncbi:hypothetical protein N0V82_002820 [Gnomoniopsis sp. IMI 355080]|nr:hypothetical protein N0V82_002820 [Gnomoniopsis sp. IMI 355080]
MARLGENEEEESQRKPKPGMTEPTMRNNSHSSRLQNARQTQGGPPRHSSEPPSKLPTGTTADSKAAFSPRWKSQSAFTPLDKRVQFVKEFDELDDESQKLAAILHRFVQIEKHQRDRLAILALRQTRGKTFQRFAAWKNALKVFSSESPQPMPVSMEETRIITWLQKCTTLEEMKECWPKAPRHKTNLHKDTTLAFISAAVRFLPNKVHMVFEAALSSQYDFYVAEDVMELLASRLRILGPEDKAATAQKLAQMAVQILSRNGSGSSVQFSQFTIRSILDDLPLDAIESWYFQLLNAGSNLHPLTEVRFARRLAKSSSNKALSAQVLMRLQEAKLLDINTPIAASVVTTILSFSKEDLAKLDQNSATPADLFRDLHGAGLIPNVITYTTIIRGLCLKGDLSTALDIFEVMQQHGVQPNEWTFSILLHGCKTRSDWAALADVTIQACHSNIRGNVLWNEVLHAIYICCLREYPKARRPRSALLYAMNSLYSRIFDAKPVKPFITGRLAEMGQHAGQKQWFPEPLRRLTAEIPPLPSKELNTPGADTLCIMLLGIIRSLPMPYDVVVFYSQYRQMLREGHPVAELMVRERGSFVHDVVLRNLLKWPSTLRVALDILRDMMRDDVRESEDDTSAKALSLVEAYSDTRSSSEPRRPSIPHPAPSLYTWTVLVAGFMKAKQPQNAEYIITLMRKNGIEPSRVTWNTLVAGYAKMQKVPEAVNAMRRLEAEGHEADDWTMRAFSYIVDKKKAIDLMEATVEANKAHKLAADLQYGQQSGELSPDEREIDAEDAVEQMPHNGASYDEAGEREEDEFFDRELDAGLGLNPDTPLDTHVDVDLGVEGGKIRLPGFSRLMAKVAGSRRGMIRELEKVAPVEGSRYDTEVWQQLRERGLDALNHASGPPNGDPYEAPQSKPITMQRR